MQKNLFGYEPLKSDIVYTPESVAKEIIDWLQPKGKCLDPCFGDGAFHKYLPKGSDWCEVKKGRDFFDYDKKVDWIIGNPPYSIFEDWLDHSFEIAENVAYILPTNKVFQRQIIMRKINNWGGIKAVRVYGSGSMVGFPFGFSVGTFYFKKNYVGKCDLVLATKSPQNSPPTPLPTDSQRLANNRKAIHNNEFSGLKNESRRL